MKHHASLTPDQPSKEPSPDFEITFSPRGKTPTSPAQDIRKGNKYLETVDGGCGDIKEADSPPTRPQSPEQEQKVSPERLNVGPAKVTKKGITNNKKVNEPICNYESGSYKESFPQRTKSSQDTHKNKNDIEAESMNFEDSFPQRTKALVKEGKKLATYGRSGEQIDRAESPDFGLDFPARITSIPSKDVKKPTAYKKSIFKSRAKPVVVEPPPPPVAASSPRSTEPPRVPPISLPDVNISRPDSTSLSDFDSMDMDFPP